MIAFIFPGQGSQKVGMGRDWAEAFEEARLAFEQADDALGFGLSQLCWEGPEEELQLTANTQPAILACSIAMHRVVGGAGLVPTAVAGHSLGEYSALVAAGALDFETALRLVRRRGQLMQAAVPTGEGAMAALMGLSAEAVEEVTREASGDEICAVANLNSPLQTVIAGHRGAVERAIALAAERGARRGKLLPVSAPFHSPLMKPARDALVPLLAEVEFRNPAMPVVSNVDAAPVTLAAAARDALERQVDGAVRWVDSVRWMIDVGGVERFLEIGHGKVLTALGRRIDKAVAWTALPKPDAVCELLASLTADPV